VQRLEVIARESQLRKDEKVDIFGIGATEDCIGTVKIIVNIADLELLVFPPRRNTYFGLTWGANCKHAILILASLQYPRHKQTKQ